MILVISSKNLQFTKLYSLQAEQAETTNLHP